MIDPSAVSAAKDWAVAIGGFLGTAGAAALGAWKLRGRHDRRRFNEEVNEQEFGPFHYVGDPDESIHKLTRKEWHVTLGHVDRHGVELANHENELKRLGGMVSEIAARRIWEGFTRLEEQFKAHVARWEDGAVRAQQDRDEMFRRFDRIEARLDGNH